MLILFASLMHILWGVLILCNGTGLPISATRVLLELIPAFWVRALIYIGAGLLPLLRWVYPGKAVVITALLPQQLLLILSGIGAIVSVTTGMYADGAARSPLFIAADQAIYVILAILYSFESIDRLNESG